MKERLRMMERAKDFRVARERAEEMALATANVSLRNAEQGLACARKAQTMAAEEALRALAEGTHVGQVMSSSLRHAFGFDCDHYERVMLQKVECARQAEEILRQRRLESEQAVTLYKHARQALLEHTAKREQAEMVERFLSRSRWSSAKIRVKSLSEPAAA